MGARKKLNVAYLNGSLLAALGLGLFTGSWLVFGLALVMLVAANVYAGQVRPGGRR